MFVLAGFLCQKRELLAISRLATPWEKPFYGGSPRVEILWIDDDKRDRLESRKFPACCG